VLRPFLGIKIVKLPFRLVVLGLAFVLTVEDSTAEAAKGVKKTGLYTVYGRVMRVQRGNGSGRFLVTTAYHHKKAAAAANLAGGAAARPRERVFLVGPATQFIAVRGPTSIPASFASLRQGERVRVRAQGQQAAIVQIFPQHNHPGTMQRHRNVRARRTTVGSAATAQASMLPVTPAISRRTANAAHLKPASAHRQSRRK
jgi:hypothetical protein